MKNYPACKELKPLFPSQMTSSRFLQIISEPFDIVNIIINIVIIDENIDNTKHLHVTAI